VDVNVALPAIRTLALCAGYGGLELGLAAALEYHGREHRVAAYVEREAYAAALLAHRMEAGDLAHAPIWSDLCTFDAGRWRGAVDCVAAGFPCQPHSVAGSRKGIDDARWIWPDIARIVLDSGAWLVVLENVPGLLTSGGFGPVLGDLAEMGFDAEWGCLSAASVGASHERERVFIVAHSRLQYRNLQQRKARPEHPRSSGELADAASNGRRQSQPVRAPRQPHDGVAQLADANRSRLQGGVRHETANGWPDIDECGTGLFAPGPDDPRWPDILGTAPWCTPAIRAGSVRVGWDDATQSFVALPPESGVRELADGPAVVVDEYRAHQLRLGGNGVVPLQAATAIAVLLGRIGFCAE
jgi:DNA (cytosine-5)-methyltransferase 1